MLPWLMRRRSRGAAGCRVWCAKKARLGTPPHFVAQGPLAYVAARKRKATPRSRFFVGIARRTQAGDPTVRGHVCDRD